MILSSRNWKSDREGCKGGDSSCQNTMGCYYLEGIGMEKDTEKGITLLRKAAREKMKMQQSIWQKATEKASVLKGI